MRVTSVTGVSAGLSLITVEADGKSVLLVDEAISNTPTLIGPAPFRLVFWLTGSGPGIARNKVWWWTFARDKVGIARAILSEMDCVKPPRLAAAARRPDRTTTGERALAGARTARVSAR